MAPVKDTGIPRVTSAARLGRRKSESINNTRTKPQIAFLFSKLSLPFRYFELSFQISTETSSGRSLRINSNILEQHLQPSMYPHYQRDKPEALPHFPH